MKQWGWLLICTLTATSIWYVVSEPNEMPTPDLNQAVMTNQVTAVIGDGSRLFLGLGNGVIQVWDIDKGVRIDEFVAHDGGIRALLIERDLLISVGMKGSVARWKDGVLVQRVRLTDSHLLSLIHISEPTRPY